MTEPETPRSNTLVHYEVQGRVAVVTLDDPPANTYSYEMMRQLDDAREGLAACLGKRKPQFGGR